MSPALVRLLEASEPEAREHAWEQFLHTYNRILLHVAHSLRGGHDAVMDRYTCVLEQLRADDFHRLRMFVADGRSEFTTWLVVVAQRVCLDHHRHQYGRRRAGASSDGTERVDDYAARRRLVDLLGAQVDLSLLDDAQSPSQEETLLVGETLGALDTLLGELSPPDRLLLKLRFEDDLSVREIADHLGLRTRFQVYRRLSDVLEQLRHALRRRGITDPVP